ncbi:MAG: hypothetical protein OEV42_16905 [Deltaproteobacteria bacterium]|nr:hypothetical protein [Deltaproteobacteria bacterium]
MSNKVILSLMTILFTVSYIESSSGPSATTVKTFKSDSSKQCEGPGVPLSEMELELTDNSVEVISSNCGYITGVTAPALCGATTLGINIYEINITQLDTV